MNVYYVAATANLLAVAPPVAASAVDIRSVTPDDVAALAAVYLTAYDPPIVATLDEAIAEIASNFDGSWGEPWLDASPSAWIGDDLVGVAQTVRRPSWEDAPDCSWLIDVFVAPHYRRSGIARALIAGAGRAVHAAGERRIGLTVDTDNVAAVTLYQSIGFHETP